jgi:hypothetical protein
MAENDSSSTTMIVALVAILVIVALGFLLFRQTPAGGSTTNTPGANIDVSLPGGSAGTNY